jgi:hypothetical protein
LGRNLGKKTTNVQRLAASPGQYLRDFDGRKFCPDNRIIRRMWQNFSIFARQKKDKNGLILSGMIRLKNALLNDRLRYWQPT